MKTFTPGHKSVSDQLKEIITPSGKSYYDVQRQKARVTALMLAMSAIISLIFLVFAFVQKAAADTARQEAERNHVLAIQNEALAAEQAKQHQEIARQLEVELVKCKEAQSK
ncbi:MAG TPA: hypothetical protein VGD65_19845 [Chryseosolibacter sp.]